PGAGRSGKLWGLPARRCRSGDNDGAGEYWHGGVGPAASDTDGVAAANQILIVVVVTPDTPYVILGNVPEQD
ncbi:MAG: hypothetical protein VYE35_06740, partial [Chloroflexota bacterium]|nr:hypothetical protein [Chloroflexota bacterium]